MKLQHVQKIGEAIAITQGASLLEIAKALGTDRATLAHALKASFADRYQTDWKGHDYFVLHNEDANQGRTALISEQSLRQAIQKYSLAANDSLKKAHEHWAAHVLLSGGSSIAGSFLIGTLLCPGVGSVMGPILAGALFSALGEASAQYVTGEANQGFDWTMIAISGITGGCVGGGFAAALGKKYAITGAKMSIGEAVTNMGISKATA